MLKVYNPSPALADYICCFWSLETPCAGHTELVYPSGKIQLIFHYGKPFRDRDSSGNEFLQPQFAVCGQKTSYSHVTAEKSSGMIAAVLKTESASALFRLPLNELTDYTVSMTEIFKSWKNSESIFCDCADDLSGIRVIEKFLIKLIGKHRSCHNYFVKSCVEEIRHNRGLSLPFSSMENFNLSERSLQRIFKDHVGISPKKFADIMRLENSIDLFRQGKTLTDVCYESGYYDQPHFIKSFRRFTGYTPSEFSSLV